MIYRFIKDFTEFLRRTRNREKKTKTLTTGKIVQAFPNDEYPNEISFDGQTTYVEMLPRGRTISWNALFSWKAHVQGKAE